MSLIKKYLYKMEYYDEMAYKLKILLNTMRGNGTTYIHILSNSRDNVLSSEFQI